MTTTKKFTLKQYQRNQENNHHTENAVKLVHMYGTIEEIAKIDQLAALEKAQDGLTMQQSRERYDIGNKYYKQFLTDQQQQPQEPTLGIEFPEAKHVDLFEHEDQQPEALKEVLKQYEGSDCDTYEVLAEIQKAVEAVGYTFDYYLDAVPFGLRPLGVELSELEGYEDMKGAEQ